MVRHSFAAALGALIVCVSGCSLNAPKYTPSLDNANRLRDAHIDPIKVAKFTADEKNRAKVDKITLRANTYASPYNGSFISYVEEAARMELAEARALDPNAATLLDGTLLRNDVDVGMAKGSADIEAQFVLRRGGAVRYDKIKKAHSEWDSSFVGAIAIPAAAENYPGVVQKLMNDLFSDPDFINAAKP